MPFEVTWLVEDRIILSRVWGTDASTADELKPYDAAIVNLLDASKAEQVHMVFDARKAESMPSIGAFRAFTFPKHPKFMWTVSLRTSNRLITILIAATTQLFRTRIRYVDTPQDAIAFLRNLEADLPDLTPYLARLEDNDDTASLKS
jgi:hypothetical protein